MSPALLSQARRIAHGNPDLEQNILAHNCVNYANAKSRGKVLSIGEQVNFMKHRAGEFRSGIRNNFGARGHKANDVFNKRLYYDGEVELHSFHYEDNGDNEECPENGKGSLTLLTAMRNTEDSCIFRVDLENFLMTLSNRERTIFLKRLEGYKKGELAKTLKLNPTVIRQTLTTVGKKYVLWFDILHAERFGLA